VFQPLSLLTGIPLQAGPVSLHPHFSYRLLHGDGIPAQAGERVKTTTHDISPGILFSIGTKWSVDYTPSWTYYSSDLLRDTVDHAVRLNGGTTFEDWGFGLGFSYVSDSPAVLELGRQASQETYSTNLNVTRHLGGRALLELSTSGTARYGSAFNNSSDWRSRLWLNYQATPRINTGLGLGLGRTDVDAGSDMTSGDIGARIGWKLTEKITVNADAGSEKRRFRTPGIPARSNPVYSGSLNYAPRDGTRLSVTASEAVSASYVQDQLTERSSWGVTLEQRVLKQFNLSLRYSRGSTDYVSTAAGEEATASRSDSSKSFSARLSTALLRRLSVSLIYQDTSNRSNESTFDVTSSQVGLELGARF
jgi:hypothetical protein